MTDVRQNIASVKKRIHAAARNAGRNPDEVRLVAVSKRMPVKLIKEAMAAGQVLFGENYLQEAAEKIEAIGPGPRWHFIGHLQSNKAKLAAELFDCIETVDRIKLANRLERRLAELDKKMDVLVQVNIGLEEQKSGIRPEDAPSFIRDLEKFEHLQVTGLMAMPPFFTDPEKVRPYFARMRELAENLVAKGLLGRQHPLELSMGMSGDFEVAIEEGATLVRVGTALFGERT